MWQKKSHALPVYEERTAHFVFQPHSRKGSTLFPPMLGYINIWKYFFQLRTREARTHTHTLKTSCKEIRTREKPYRSRFRHDIGIIVVIVFMYSSYPYCICSGSGRTQIVHLQVYKSRDKDLQGCYPFIVAFVSLWLISPSCSSPALDWTIKDTRRDIRRKRFTTMSFRMIVLLPSCIYQDFSPFFSK